MPSASGLSQEAYVRTVHLPATSARPMQTRPRLDCCPQRLPRHIDATPPQGKPPPARAAEDKSPPRPLRRQKNALISRPCLRRENAGEIAATGTSWPGSVRAAARNTHEKKKAHRPRLSGVGGLPWRRRELNPGPKVLHRGHYVCSRYLIHPLRRLPASPASGYSVFDFALQATDIKER